MSDLSINYCEQRARDEDRAAARATCTEATLAHRQMARRYADKARKMRRAEGSAKPARRPILSLRTARD
ncbi:hypothetical protein J2X47_000534 [Sphingomonas sp. BE270]|jgi:hypothetical protein|nr:hypothetical protein [Sphingomonas sp. BE270]